MKVAVFGTGGVGAYFGGRLALDGAEVHLIARGVHLEALRTSGLRVTSPKGDFQVDLPATDDPLQVGPCDYVLFFFNDPCWMVVQSRYICLASSRSASF